MDFMKKYLKYKKKYIQLKNQLGGEKYNEHDIIIGLNGYIDPKYENDEDYILTAIAIDKKKDIKVLLYISDKLKGSVDFFKQVVKINGLGLQYGNRDIKNNKEIVLAAVKNNGYAISFASNDLKKDSEVIMAAVEQNGEVLKIFPRARIININRDIVLAAVTQNGKAFYYVRMFSDSFERFKKDKEIVSAAVENNGLALEYAGEQFKKDKDIVLAAVTNNYLAIRFMDSSLNNDIEISVKVYEKNSDYIKNFSEDVQDYIKKNYK